MGNWDSFDDQHHTLLFTVWMMTSFCLLPSLSFPIYLSSIYPLKPNEDPFFALLVFGKNAYIEFRSQLVVRDLSIERECIPFFFVDIIRPFFLSALFITFCSATNIKFMNFNCTIYISWYGLRIMSRIWCDHPHHQPCLLYLYTYLYIYIYIVNGLAFVFYAISELE